MVNKILERNDINWQYDLTIHISADLDSRGSFLTKISKHCWKGPSWLPFKENWTRQLAEETICRFREIS